MVLINCKFRDNRFKKRINDGESMQTLCIFFLKMPVYFAIKAFDSPIKGSDSPIKGFVCRIKAFDCKTNGLEYKLF